jgi:hypothetical protein
LGARGGLSEAARGDLIELLLEEFDIDEAETKVTKQASFMRDAIRAEAASDRRPARRREFFLLTRH